MLYRDFSLLVYFIVNKWHLNVTIIINNNKVFLFCFNRIIQLIYPNYIYYYYFDNKHTKYNFKACKKYSWIVHFLNSPTTGKSGKKSKFWTLVVCVCFSSHGFPGIGLQFPQPRVEECQAQPGQPLPGQQQPAEEQHHARLRTLCG